MTEQNYNSNKFYHSILIDRNLPEVFSFTATGGGLEKWFIGRAEFRSPENIKRKNSEIVQTGDKFQIDWLAKDLSVNGEVIEVKDNSRFSFTFGHSFIVTITVKQQGARTFLTLKQEYTPGAVKNEFSHINCCVCWAFFVTNLKSVAEHGIDLRETGSEDESLVNR